MWKSTWNSGKQWCSVVNVRLNKSSHGAIYNSLVAQYTILKAEIIFLLALATRIIDMIPVVIFWIRLKLVWTFCMKLIESIDFLSTLVHSGGWWRFSETYQQVVREPSSNFSYVICFFFQSRKNNWIFCFWNW